MKKLLIALCLFLIGLAVFAETEINDVKMFFHKFVRAANSYDKAYFNYYTDNPRIIRVVIKPDGQKVPVTVPFERYKKESKLGMKVGRIKKYKNNYTNISVSQVDESTYKLTALRHPSTGKERFNAYFIIVKSPSGQYKIQEESMETPVQKFLDG